MVVKLNNPLMGTETTLRVVSLVAYQDLQVKLNNPQMGTETFQDRSFKQRALKFVKLNNPLMGTETQVLHFQIQ